MAEQTQSCRAQLEFPSQKSIAEQPWSQEAKGIFNGHDQRGEDSPPQALQHPGASPFPDTKVSPWCHWGGQPGFVTSASPSTAPLPARGTKPQQDSAQVGLEMGTPEPPSQLGHPQLTCPLCAFGQSGQQLQSSFCSSQHCSAILHSWFYEAGTETNELAGSWNLQAHTWFTVDNRGVHWLGHYFLPAPTFFISKRMFLHRRNHFFSQNNSVILILWTTLIKDRRKKEE